MNRDIVILSETDTTVGFLSQNAYLIDKIKGRPSGKRYITALASLSSLKSRCRVPEKFRKYVRRANKTTFIFPNGESYRVVKDKRHLLLIERYGRLHTTSANISGKEIDLEFAKEKADIIIYPLKNHGRSSTIIKLGRKRKKRIR